MLAYLESLGLNHVIEDKPIARIDGKEVPLDEAIDEAAKVLMDAKFPILYGMVTQYARLKDNARQLWMIVVEL